MQSSLKLAKPTGWSSRAAARPYSRLNFPSRPVFGRCRLSGCRLASGVRTLIASTVSGSTLMVAAAAIGRCSA